MYFNFRQCFFAFWIFILSVSICSAQVGEKKATYLTTQILKIEGPDTLSKAAVNFEALPQNWAEDLATTRSVGDLWLSEERFLLIEVPSILVPETWNVQVNPRHPEANLLQITMTYEHASRANSSKYWDGYERKDHLCAIQSSFKSLKVGLVAIARGF